MLLYICNMTPRKRPEDKLKTGRPQKWTKDAAMKLIRDYHDWLYESSTNLFFSDFCRSRNLYPQIISELEHKYPEFSEALKRVESIRKDNLCKSALTGVFNSTFSIFYAKNEFGMTDKQERELYGKDGGPIQYSGLDDFYRDVNP